MTAAVENGLKDTFGSFTESQMDMCLNKHSISDMSFTDCQDCSAFFSPTLNHSMFFNDVSKIYKEDLFSPSNAINNKDRLALLGCFGNGADWNFVFDDGRVIKVS